MSYQFTITLVGEIYMDVRPVRRNDVIIEYDIYMADIYHCTIYPDIEDAFIEWKSSANIDPHLVQMMGRAIESHEE